MAQPQQFSCDACGRTYAWKPQLAGKRAKCKCGQAINVPAQSRNDVPERYEIIPTREANALVEYLMSLQSDVRLFEAPLLTNRVAGAAAPAAEPTPPASENQ